MTKTAERGSLVCRMAKVGHYMGLVSRDREVVLRRLKGRTGSIHHRPIGRMDSRQTYSSQVEVLGVLGFAIESFRRSMGRCNGPTKLLSGTYMYLKAGRFFVDPALSFLEPRNDALPVLKIATKYNAEEVGL